MLNRRDILSLGASAVVSGTLTPSHAASAEEDSTSVRIVDTNVSLFHWPFRRLPLDNTKVLIEKFRSLGIAQAWAGSFEGLLHRDISSVNSRLVAECDHWPELIPIGSINLTLPNWKVDLDECLNKHNMVGVRLHPNYHGYSLDDVRFVEAIRRATDANCFVQIASAMEDTRTQHESVQVADVDLAPLVEVVAQVEHVRVQILNYRPRGSMFESLAKTDGIYFDTSRVESTDGVPKLVGSLPQGRVLFGSHSPFLVPEAAMIRVHESGQLDASQLRQVFSGNATKMLATTTS